MIRRSWLVASLASLALLAGLFLFPLPADAAPAKPTRSFSWTFEGTCCITSRTFTSTRTANVTITAVFEGCTRPDGPEFMIGLWRNGRFVGTRKFVCFGAGVWRDQRPGDFKFKLQVLPPWLDAGTYSAYGTGTYGVKP